MGYDDMTDDDQRRILSGLLLLGRLHERGYVENDAITFNMFRIVPQLDQLGGLIEREEAIEMAMTFMRQSAGHIEAGDTMLDLLGLAYDNNL